MVPYRSPASASFVFGEGFSLLLEKGFQPLSLDHEEHPFGHVGGVIAYSCEMPRHPEETGGALGGGLVSLGLVSDNEEEFVPILKKGTPLPAVEKRSFVIPKNIRPGNKTDIVKIIVWEGIGGT